MTPAEWDAIETKWKIQRGIMPKNWRYTTAEALLFGKTCAGCGKKLDVPDDHLRGEDGEPLCWAFLSPLGGAYHQTSCAESLQENR